jgi:hypothetical protein
MSFQAMALAISVPLPAAKKALLLCLANYADEEMNLFPSISTLASDAGLSNRSVIRYLKGFENSKLILKKKRSRDNGSQKSNEYSLRIVTWLKANGFDIQLNDKGFLVVKAKHELGGDCVSPPPYDTQSPPPMTESHPPYDTQSPLEPITLPCQLEPHIYIGKT